ncbi:MAG: TadE/TadG family type IV pilus assembly protein [Pirellulaceae bacterium]
MFTPTSHRIARPRRTRRQNRRNTGAACVEMAFVAPFVFMLVFTSVEFARIMMVKQSLTNSARAGCRTASLVTTRNANDAEDTARGVLRGTVADYDNPAIVRVSTTPDFSASPDQGTTITVDVEVDCADVSWLPSMFFAGAKIGASATMIRE